MTSASNPNPDGRGRRVVVIDDDLDLREVLAELIEVSGHQVWTAADGRSGLALILAERPDVALVDLRLPDLDGLAIARAVRSELAGHPIKLVAMTGYGRDSDRAEAYAAGFDVHLTKPANAAAILGAIEA